MKSGFYVKQINCIEYEKRWIVGLLPDGSALSIVFNSTGSNYAIIKEKDVSDWELRV